MDDSSRRKRRPPGDPLVGSGSTPTSSRRPATSPAAKRQHPARGARVFALAASVTATAGIAGAMALADGDSNTTSPMPDSDSATSSAGGSAASTEANGSVGTTPSTAVAASKWADGVWTGTAEHTEWGDVQVEATIADGELVDVTVLQVPSGRESTPINDGAVPVLEAQAIELQSADIDVVSGATYTSRTYAASLQAALDEAQLAQAAPS